MWAMKNTRNGINNIQENEEEKVNMKVQQWKVSQRKHRKKKKINEKKRKRASVSYGTQLAVVYYTCH